MKPKASGVHGLVVRKDTLKVLNMALKDFINGNTNTQKSFKETKAPKQEIRVETTQEKKIEKPDSTKQNLFITSFSRPMKKAELWFGNPGNGKTTLATKICESFKEKGEIEDYAVVKCEEEMTVMSLLKTTKTNSDGDWMFTYNKIFKMLTDEMQKTYIIIMDEFNTMPMTVMKALQPIIDDTVGRFEFEDKTFEKNPNVNFIFTMNHNDLGISELPIAIKDRLYPKYFRPLDKKELEKRSGVPSKLIDLLGKIWNMFEHLGALPDFHNSVRQLKYLRGASREQVEDYVISQLELANIEYEQALNMSPEFENFLEEFENTQW